MSDMPECLKCKSNSNVIDLKELNQRGKLITKKFKCQKCNLVFHVVIRQFVVPSVFTFNLGSVYTSECYADSYESEWLKPHTWKTWGATAWNIIFHNKGVLNDYFKWFKVEIKFVSNTNGEIQSFALGYGYEGSQLEYSFSLSNADEGYITLRILAQTKKVDLGVHEVVVTPIDLIEWCP